MDEKQKQWAKPLKAKYQCRCPGCLSMVYEGQPIYLVDHQWLCRQCYYAAKRAGAA